MATKAERTLKLLTSPEHQSLYSMQLERKLKTEHSLNRIMPELQRMSGKATVRAMLARLREAIKSSLFGCEVNVAVCSDASVTRLEFITDGNYVRQAVRGNSTCFECLDQRDVVLQAASRVKASDVAQFTSGESVVYVPLIGRGGGVGIVEIHGLQVNEVSNFSRYERNPDALKAMVQAHDYRFKDTIRLWRLPGGRTGGMVIKEATATPVTLYHIVCGRISGIATEKNGVPYIGGVRYIILWEDGLQEEAVTGQELLKAFVHTPQSLGCCSTLDETLLEQLLKVGFGVGELLERQRIQDVVKKLRVDLFVPNLSDVDVAEKTLDAAGEIVTGIRVAYFLGFDKAEDFADSLCVRFPSARTVDRALKNSYLDVVRSCMSSSDSCVPTTIEDGASLEWVVVEASLPAGYQWQREPRFSRFFAAIIRYKNLNKATGAVEVDYFCEMIAVLSESLNILHLKTLRNRRRLELTKEIESQIYDWRNLPISDVCKNVLLMITEVLPAPTAIYVGVIEQGGNLIRFAAANSCSGMEGKHLRRGKGISFEVMETMNPVILKEEDADKRKMLKPGAIVDVVYGKIAYRATVVADRGHELYDVLFEEDKSMEMGVAIHRITPVHTAFRTEKFGPFRLPFVSIPLRNRNKGLGVLNLDNFQNVPKAPYDPQPELGVLHFLEKLGRIIGTTYDTQRKKASLKAFARVCRNVNASMENILEAFVEALESNLYYFTSVSLIQVVKIPKPPRNTRPIEIRELFSRGTVPSDILNALRNYDPAKSNLKPIQLRGDKTIWLLCRLRTESKANEGKFYIASISQRNAFNDPDTEFMQTMQKVLLEGLQGLDSRKARGEVRFETLREIKQLCSKWQTMDRHTLFAEITALIEFCFFTANIYVGRIGMHNKFIRFFLASRLSAMKGQVLKRSMNDGVCFNAIDTGKNIMVTQTSANAKLLHHFGPREQFEYPYLVVPIVAHVDALIGVLCADACDDAVSDSERLEGIISYFGTVASHLSAAIKGYAALDAIAELDRIGNCSRSFKDGIHEIKKVLLGVLPFAMRVGEIVYRPKETRQVRGARDIAAIDDYIIYIRVLSLESLSKASVQPVGIDASWHGEILYRSKFKDDEVNTTPFSFEIKAGASLELINLLFTVRGPNNKELSRRTIGFHYLVNTPLYSISHVFDTPATASKEVHIAKMNLLTRVFRRSDPIAFCITSIHVEGLFCASAPATAGQLNLPDAYALIKWNDVEVSKTNCAAKTADPEWTELDVNLKIDSRNAGHGILTLEIWDTDLLGRGLFFGRIELSEIELSGMFSAGHAESEGSWILLKSHPSVPAQLQRVQGRVRLFGSKLIASELTGDQILNELDLHLSEEYHAKEEVVADVKYRSCELKILSARDLTLKTRIDDAETIDGAFNTFVSVTFNGEEVGRTGAVQGACPVTWEEESFTLRVPEGPGLIASTLLVEVMQLGALGKASTLGRCELSGKRLSRLLSGIEYREKWFVLRPPSSGAEIDRKFCRGEVKLGGRPMDTPCDPKTMLRAEELGFLELNLSRGCHVISHALKSTRPNAQYVATVLFDDILVHQTKPYGFAGSSLDIEWVNEKAVFRYPPEKPLRDCMLTIELWPVNAVGALEKTSLGSCTIVGDSVDNLLGKKFCYFSSLPFSRTADLARNSTDVKVSFHKHELRVFGGPLNAPRRLPEDGNELWLDVLAASSLVSKLREGTDRSNPFCVVTWNDRVAGKTAIVLNSFDPIWKRQRVSFNLPTAVDQVDSSFDRCHLIVEVFDWFDENKSERLGLISLKGSALVAFLGQDRCQSTWFPLELEESSSLAGDVSYRGFDRTARRRNVEEKASLGEIKLRGGLANSPIAVVDHASSGEYQFDVISARGLGQSDPFKKSNPFVIIEWCHREKGRTRVIENTLAPIYSPPESFLLRVPGGSTLFESSLTASVWTFNKQGGNEFLGCVSLSGRQLLEFFETQETTTRREFELGKSIELTEDENYLADGRGRLTLGVRKDLGSTIHEILTQQVCLYIDSARDLTKCNAFNTSTDAYCRVFRRSEYESPEEEEIYVSSVVYDSTHPEFESDAIVFRVPADNDWSSIFLRVEVWDTSGDFLGCVTLNGEPLHQLLCRTSEFKEPITYPLVSRSFPDERSLVHVKGELLLSGGLKHFIDTQDALEEGSSLGSAKDIDFLDLAENSGQEVVFRVIRANGLGKADAFVGSSNPYCVAKWNGKVVFHTDSLHGTVDPVWSDASFKIRLPRSDMLDKCSLRVEILHSDPLLAEGVFLGRARIDGHELTNLLSSEGHEMEFPLTASAQRTAMQNRLVRPHSSVFLSCQVVTMTSKEAPKKVVVGLSACKLKFRVLHCSDLSNVGLFMHPPSAFVSIFSPEDAASPIAKTKVVSSDANPEFEEVLWVDKPDGKSFAATTVRLAVHNKNSVSADDFLGEIILQAAELETFLNNAAPETFTLVKSRRLPDKSQQFVKGTITLFGEITFEERGPSAHKKVEVPKGMRELEFTVVAARGLAQASIFGPPSPYCVVSWDGKEIGTTSVVRDTLDPVWENDETFDFIAPERFGTLKRRTSRKLLDQNQNAEHEKEVGSRLIVDVYDKSRFGSNTFLGCVELGGEELEEFATSGKLQCEWLPLRSSTRHKGSEQRTAPQGKIQVLLMGKETEAMSFEGRDIDLVICQVVDLMKVDTFGSADPYVKVRWNYKTIGKTEVIKNTMNPVWSNEVFTMRKPGGLELIDCFLYLEVWDWNLTSSGTFLGAATFGGKDLQKQLLESNFESFWLPLTTSPYYPENSQECVQGKIELKLGFTGTQQEISKKKLSKYDITICKANELNRAEGIFGLSDPYVKVKWNSREIGRSIHASKTLDPVWEDQYVTLEIDEGSISNSQNELLFEVWNHTLISKEDFLGCVSLTKASLKDFLDSHDDTMKTFNLAPSQATEESRRAKIRGTLSVTVKKLDDDGGDADGPKFTIQWSAEREIDAGNPTLDFSILRANGLMIAKSLVGSSDPYCVVSWNDLEIGSTSVVKRNLNPVWIKEDFSLKMTPATEESNAFLKVEVWDSDAITKHFLGSLELSYWSIIRLCEGEFTFPLCMGTAEPNAAVRGSITVHLRISFPYWDSIVPRIPLVTRRRIKIISGMDLPLINDEQPSTKCVLSFHGAVKAKTILIDQNSEPVWPKAQCEVMVDIAQPFDVTIEVFHVDIVEQKDISIGQAVLPFEYLLRPSPEPFDIFLGPPTKPPPRKYKFTVSGAVQLQVINAASSNGADEFQPFSAAQGQHLAAYLVEDLLANRISASGSEQALVDGPSLTPEQLHWLGTTYTLTSVHTLSTQREWVIVPYFDLGLRMGHRYVDFHGTIPGQRSAFCIQRQLDRVNVSDSYILEDISSAVQSCVLKLRRKEVFGALREMVIAKYRQALSEVIKKDVFDIELLWRWLVKALTLTIPGATVHIGRMSTDMMSLFTTIYQKNGTEVREVTVVHGQGFDWELVGRHPPRSVVIQTASDLENRNIIMYEPMPNSTLPKIFVPFLAGDVASAYFSIDHLDIYRCGLTATNKISEELTPWLEDIGALFGDAMYHGKEKKALRILETYASGWSSSVPGLLQLIMKQCMLVLQACKLIEIWSLKNDDSLESVGVVAAEPPVQSGRHLNISRITITADSNSALAQMFSSAKGALAHHEEKKLDIEEFDDETRSKSTTTKSTQWLCGVRYNGMEQCKLAPLGEPLKDGENPHLLTVEDMKLLITQDRTIVVSLYEVDKQLQVIQEFSGKVTFSTLQEKSLRVTITPFNKNGSGSFHAELLLAWPKDFRDNSDEVVEVVQGIQSFTLSLKRAKGLSNPNSTGLPSTFCEVHSGKKLIGKTAVVKSSLEPEWNESFTIQYKKKPTSFTIEVYESSFLGKGAFLGKVDVSFKDLLNPTVSEIELPLQHKLGLNAKKQKSVGGSLFLEYSYEISEVDDSHSPDGSNNQLATIPWALWNMGNPALLLTIGCATDLAKSNMFGGSSDPYVIVYSSNSEDPLFKTKVIDNCLDPVWNESFTINFGVNMQPDSTVIRDFPDVTLEVWDYNRTNRGTFLGCCVITPFHYFKHKTGDFPLGPSSRLKEKDNKIVQGNISVKLSLVDNVSTVGSQKFRYGSLLKTLNVSVFADIKIIRCKDLMPCSRLTGKSNPYVVVVWQNKVFGETKAVKNSLNPSWNQEHFVINLTLASHLIDELILQVWDKDFFTEGTFMGEIRVPPEQLLHPSANNYELPLRNRPEGKPNTKIKGTITFKIIQQSHIQRVEYHQPEFIEEKSVETMRLEPMKLAVVRDPEEEGKRQLYEKASFPGLLNKARLQMERYIKHPFERVGLISELHYGQILSACKRCDATTLKTELSDMCAIPSGKASAEQLIIVSRFDSGKLPRRDVQFLTKVRDILTRCVVTNEQRTSRNEGYSALKDNIGKLEAASRESPTEIIRKGIPMIEQAINCNLKVFLLGTDGETLFPCNKNTGRLIETVPASDFIQQAARVCRHSLLVQMFRGVHSLFDLKWELLSQMSTIPLLSANEQLSCCEAIQVCSNVSSLGAVEEADGCCLVPMIGKEEAFIGLLVVEAVDRFPDVIYRTKPLPSTLQGSGFDDSLSSSYSSQAPLAKPPKSKAGNVHQIIETRAPEDGFLQILRESSGLLSDSVLVCRFEHAKERFQSLEISANTPLLDVIRFFYRVICTALPHVREMSIWGINVDKMNEITPETVAPVVKKRFTLFSSPFPSKIATDDGDDAVKKQSKDPPIVCAYFSSEDPRPLLATPSERKSYESTKGLDKSDRYRRDAIQSTREHKYILKHALEQTSAAALEWRVRVPSVFMPESEEAIASESTVPPNEQKIGYSKTFYDGELEPNEKFLSLVQKEAVRCTKELKAKTFQVASGQRLSAVGNAEVAKSVLDELFDPEYNKKKEKAERDRQMLVAKKLELETKRREKEKEKQRRAQEKAAQLGTNPGPSNDQSDEEDSNSDNDDEDKDKDTDTEQQGDSRITPNNRTSFLSRVAGASFKQKGAAPVPASLSDSSKLVVKSRKPPRAPPPPNTPSPATNRDEAEGSIASARVTPRRESPLVTRRGRRSSPGGEESGEPARQSKRNESPGGNGRSSSRESRRHRKSRKPEEDKTEFKRKRKREPKTVKLDWKYFVAVGAHGIGGDSGWGVTGEVVGKFIEEMSECLDASLQKFVLVRNETINQLAADATSSMAAKQLIRDRKTDQAAEATLRKIEEHEVQSDSSDDGKEVKDSGDASSAGPSSSRSGVGSARRERSRRPSFDTDSDKEGGIASSRRRERSSLLTPGGGGGGGGPTSGGTSRFSTSEDGIFSPHTGRDSSRYSSRRASSAENSSRPTPRPSSVRSASSSVDFVRNPKFAAVQEHDT